MTGKIAVTPCSGIGKSLGSVAREAAFIISQDLFPEKTKIIALSLLVQGDADTRRELSGAPAIAIDGCKRECAAKGLAAAGAVQVLKAPVFDIMRRHRGLKPEGIIELNDDGQRLAEEVAQAAADIIRQLEDEAHA